MGNRSPILCSAFVFAGLGPAAAFDDKAFHVVDLGTLPGFALSQANAINDEGLIAGWSGAAAPDQRHAVVWRDRSIIDIHPQGFSWSEARAINNHGQAVLVACCAGNRRVAFLWSREHGLRELPNSANAEVAGINDAGRVIGRMPTGRGFSGMGAVAWMPNGTVMELNSGLGSDGSSVNERGEMTGWIWFGGHASFTVLHAVRWSPQGDALDLGALAPGFDSQARGINRRGDVVGYSSNSFTGQADVVQHAFLWTAETGMRDIGTLGTDQATANGTNSRREVVGGTFKFASGGGFHAFYWTEKSGMEELNGLSPAQANAINEDGKIAGFSRAADGNVHAVLWTR